MSTTPEPLLFYEKHLFFCTNHRDHKKACGNDRAEALRAYAKSKIKEMGLKNIRVNMAGCLGRCKKGPVMVIYPEGTWYHYRTEQDIDAILASHIGKGEIALKQYITSD